MCGRFTLRTPPAVLIEHFDLDARGDRPLPLFTARYNIAPTQDVLVVRADGTDGRRFGSMMRWGLLPSWTAKEKFGSGPPLINARAETLAEKPTFRAAFRSRRCLIPADGFYEWQPTEGRGQKQPFYIHRPDNRTFAFAGLWERWTQRNSVSAPGESLIIESCTIVTTNANGRLQDLHERMPVILSPNDYAKWLDPHAQDSAAVARLLMPCGDDELVAEPVGTRVNKVANDDPACIALERTLF